VIQLDAKSRSDSVPKYLIEEEQEMSIAGPSYKCMFKPRVLGQFVPRVAPRCATRAYASGVKNTKTKRIMPRYAPLSLIALFPALYLLFPQAEPELSPQIYSKHKLAGSEKLSGQHVLLRIPIPAAARGMFESPDGTVALQHVMIKSPDLQIERPYTFVNDAGQDGELRLVVKRVKGGEVGRSVACHWSNEH
jgi:cytochrome-b5 reductase